MTACTQPAADLPHTNTPTPYLHFLPAEASAAAPEKPSLFAALSAEVAGPGPPVSKLALHSSQRQGHAPSRLGGRQDSQLGRPSRAATAAGGLGSPRLGSQLHGR